jgi:hypothetical protein
MRVCVCVLARVRVCVHRVTYVSIDAEGHEAQIIEGMALEDVSNRRRFAAFQFELGGTWAERNPRKAHPSWSQALSLRLSPECVDKLAILYE